MPDAQGNPTFNETLAMQSQPPSSPYSYTNTPLREYTGAILEMTDLDSPVTQIYNLLRGIEIDGEGREIKIGEPLLNKEGITAVIRMSKGTINRVSSMSLYDEREVRQLVMYLADTLIRDLMINHHIYNITTPNARSQIVNIVITMAYASTKQACDNNMKRFLKGSQQEIMTRVDTQGAGKQGKGFWKGIFGGAFK